MYGQTFKYILEILFHCDYEISSLGINMNNEKIVVDTIAKYWLPISHTIHKIFIFFFGKKYALF